MESVGIEPKRSPCKGVDLPLASAPYFCGERRSRSPFPYGNHSLSRRWQHLVASLSICGRRGNRTPKAFTPSCFQDSFLVHSDSFQLSGKLDSNQRSPASKAGEDDLTPPFPVLSKWQGSNLRSLHPKCSGIPTFLHLVIVGVVGLEPTKTNVGGFTVPCNCRYAILPNSLKTKNPEILWSQGSSFLVNMFITNLST